MDFQRLIKAKELRNRLSISNATLYRRIKDDPNFPKLIKQGRTTLFDEYEVERYIELIKAGAYSPTRVNLE